MTTAETYGIRIAAIAIVLVLIGVYVYNKHLHAQRKTLYLENANYSVQIGMYDMFKTSRADIVMLGNSLTYNANWAEMLGRANIANRGIPSDITAGYLHRLDYVYKLQPKICFIEGGVNDIHAKCSVLEIFANYTSIIDTLRGHHIIPVIQSTLFVARTWPNAVDENREVEALNKLLSEFAREHSVEFLDINALVSKDGFLRDELTFDGIHLNADGYALWVPEVEMVLVKHQL